ncbi:tetratricopeptide repeat protein [Kangiella geojedonensis]|uniref:Tetratricopeptide domain protein n=1 Tax=Kangiella geojedonensis TaxID=914150 RepID=A0A0F6RAY8_9GAMM|nr:tetratricopeptide domain protein [Kangiella geojedonensis]AKE51093.1 Tetratricopeptide domain protein [Kangiella geojedonensis]
MAQQLARIILWVSLSFFSLAAFAAEQQEQKPEKTSNYQPLIERYILDELKSVRQDQQSLRADMEEKVAHAKLDASDRIIRYTSDTLNNMFIIITTAASILVLMGWRSMRDVRSKLNEVVETKINELTSEYEDRLHELEGKLRKRSQEIIDAQEDISKSNEIHSIWMRAGLETNMHQKIKLFDEILAINPEDIEALIYKADAAYELGDYEWAFSLANRAIDQDQDYGLAYWQRACANAANGATQEAINDIKIAIEKAPKLADELDREPAFEDLHELEEFEALKPQT